MKVTKITTAKGEVFFTNQNVATYENCKTETVEMTEDEYFAIPSSISAMEFFKD